MMPTGFAARVVVPPVVGFVLLAVYVAAESLGLRAFALPVAQTVSEAAARGEAARALQLLAEGQDASTRQLVREEMLDHASHQLTPVEAAILGRRAEMVRLLQRAGAASGDLARASCFARMRLPEVLHDLGASDAVPTDRDADVETAIKACTASGAPL